MNKATKSISKTKRPGNCVSAKKREWIKAADRVDWYEYDGFDRLDKRIFPDATFEQNEVYDDNGNVLTFVTRNDEDIISTFDPLNRLKTRTPGSLPEQTMTYDLAGRLKNINTPFDAGDPTTGDYGFDYDSAGRLNEQSMPDSKTVLYELDDNGNRIKLTYPDGYYVQYFYDEINRLTDIKLNGSGTAAIHFDYDPLSRRTATVYENGCDCAYGYELNDDLGNLDHTFVGSAVAFGFDYNKVHQVIGVSVDDEAYMWVPSAPSAVNYDPANNLNQYPEVDSTAFTYNPNGCLTGGLLTSAAFDELNRLTQAVKGGVTNDYWNDPLNRQGQKAIDSLKTGFLCDGQQLIEEYGDSGDLAYRYIRGNRLDEIFIKIAGATKTYFHHDRLGSVIAVTDDGGSVLSNYVYSPFGETSSLSGTPFGFTGQRYDEEMGLYNYRARIYSPSIGRFLQPDPIEFFAGDMNLYSYVGNDAANLTDPLGLAAVCDLNAPPDFQQKTNAILDHIRRAASNDPTGQLGRLMEDIKKANVTIHPTGLTGDYTSNDGRHIYFNPDVGGVIKDKAGNLVAMNPAEMLIHELSHAAQLSKYGNNPSAVPQNVSPITGNPYPEQYALNYENSYRQATGQAGQRTYYYSPVAFVDVPSGNIISGGRVTTTNYSVLQSNPNFTFNP